MWHQRPEGNLNQPPFACTMEEQSHNVTFLTDSSVPIHFCTRSKAWCVPQTSPFFLQPPPPFFTPPPPCASTALSKHRSLSNVFFVHFSDHGFYGECIRASGEVAVPWNESIPSLPHPAAGPNPPPLQPCPWAIVLSLCTDLSMQTSHCPYALRSGVQHLNHLSNQRHQQH